MTIPHLARLHDRYGARGLRVVGISDEAPDVIEAFVNEHRLAYTIAHDDGGKASRDYLLQEIPMLVVIDKAGIIRHIGLGAEDVGATEGVVAELLR